MASADMQQEASVLPRTGTFDAPRWRLGTVVVDGRPATVIEIGDALYALDKLVAESGISTPAAPTGVRDLIDDWEVWRPILTKLAGNPTSAGALNLERLEWLPAITNPRKIVCVGINYHDHVAEMGGSAPTGRPFAFVKPENTLLGHRQTLQLPAMASKVDWEAELAIVIGKKASGISSKDAFSVIAGYCPFNDISARDWISQPTPGVGLDWILHKSFDGFGPLGPLITPAEFVPDPQNLAIRLSINGEIKQDSSTANMVFGIGPIIEHLSSVMTLMPGDVIATGTPAGVGHGRGEYLSEGDSISLSIECLGDLNTIVGSRQR